MLDEMQRYANCMEEVKLRQLAIKGILDNGFTTPFKMTNIEFICLQFRKILELIAMASLCANKRAYERVHPYFYFEWKAKEILSNIEHENPKFYPVPTKQNIVNGVVTSTTPITDGFLTRRDFEDVYNKCSSVIHINNPYKRKQVDIEKIQSNFNEWQEKITNLLSHHQIQLSKSNIQLWVIMNGKEDGRVHVYEFEKIK